MCHRQGAAPAPCNLDSRFSLCRGRQGNGREFNVNYTFIPLSDHKFLSRLRGMQLSLPNTLSCCRFHFSCFLSCLPLSLFSFFLFLSYQWSSDGRSVVEGLQCQILMEFTLTTQFTVELFRAFWFDFICLIYIRWTFLCNVDFTIKVN